MVRRAASVLAGAAVIAGAELWGSRLVFLFDGWGLVGGGDSTDVVVLLLFAFAGFCAGAAANRRDFVPLIAIELIGLVPIALSVAMAAVETGGEAVRRNAVVGALGLLAMAIVYAGLQTLRPARST